jgi:hypothetical protein
MRCLELIGEDEIRQYLLEQIEVKRRSCGCYRVSQWVAYVAFYNAIASRATETTPNPPVACGRSHWKRGPSGVGRRSVAAGSPIAARVACAKAQPKGPEIRQECAKVCQNQAGGRTRTRRRELTRTGCFDAGSQGNPCVTRAELLGSELPVQLAACPYAAPDLADAA